MYRFQRQTHSGAAFFATSKKWYKRSYRVRGMGPPQGPAFASAVPTLNKTKKQKLKKQQLLLRTVMAIKQSGARCESAKYFIAIIVFERFYLGCLSQKGISGLCYVSVSCRLFQHPPRRTVGKPTGRCLSLLALFHSQEMHAC